MTPDEIEAEYWAYHYADNPATESGTDEDFDTDEILQAIDAGDWEELINVK